METVPKVIFGDPNPDLTSTSHIERQNLTIRMGMPRMTKADERFLEEVGKLESGVCSSLRLLQFLPSPLHIEDHARNGGGSHRAPVEHSSNIDGRSLKLNY